MAREFETRTLAYLRLSPTHPLIPLAGRPLATAAVSAVAVAVAALLVVAGYGVTPDHPVEMAAGLLLCVVIFSCIHLGHRHLERGDRTTSGALASPRARLPGHCDVRGRAGRRAHATLRGARAVSMAAAVICTYLFFLGGGFTTIQFLPTWLRRTTAFVPTRYAIDGLRQSLFYPGLYGFGADMRVLRGTAAVAVVVGGAVVRRAWSR